MKEKFVSNLTKTLAVMSLLAPAGAYPLGIGEIKLHSALNQNLDAEISLVLSPGERISDVKVSLAPPDKFDERGVPWSYFLSNIIFEPSLKSDGSAVIRVRSRDVLKEPFLGLLLQVTWPKGTVYREFSLLVDPPAAYAQAVAPAMSVPEAITDEASLPAKTPPASAFMPEPFLADTKPETRPASQEAILKGVYGPIRKNESLWEISVKASRQHKVSVEQMMVAIYKENPAAFYRDNVNALLAKVKIKIPDRNTVMKLSRKQAKAEYKRQIEAWTTLSRTTTDQTTKSADLAADQGGQSEKSIDNQLTLAAPAESTIKDDAVITPGQEKNDSTMEKDRSLTKGGSSDEEMQQRVAALEEQLAKMQALLTLKEQQLAAIQNQAQKASAGSAAAVELRSLENDAHHGANQTASLDKSDSGAAQTAITKAEDNSFSLGFVGGIGLVVLSVLGLLWGRKRNFKNLEPMDNESTFSSSVIQKSTEPEISLLMPAVNENTVHDLESFEKSSFLSEFTPSDFDAFDADQGEIDPVSEADVYLAYGRFQQAEELMRHEIESHPERDEYKLKLLEIYFSQQNGKAFETYVKELMDAGKHEYLAFWEKVSEMSKEIISDSLFLAEVTNDVAGSVKGDQISIRKSAERDGLTEKTVDMDMQFDSEFTTASDQASFSEALKKINSEKMDAIANFNVSSFTIDKTERDHNAIESDYPNNAFIDFDLNAPSSQEGEKFEDTELSSSAQSKPASIQVSDEPINAYPDDIDFDFEFSLIEAGPEDEDADLKGVSDLTDMDELETKLDLARAYRDMGDNDSAKDIIAEVFEKGTTLQKKQAQVLFGDLI